MPILVKGDDVRSGTNANARHGRVKTVLRKIIDEKKATGLGMIPSKLLKMAASIVAPSLTAIFTKSIITEIYPTEWKTARVTPVFKKGVKSDLNNYRQISVIAVVSKVFKKMFTTNCTNT